MGSSEPGGTGMRLFEDDLIFEFRSDHILVTNLLNHSMPLIRYRMDDVLEPMNQLSRHGPFQLVRDVVGRTEQPLEFASRDGGRDFIHPIVIAEFFVPHLAAFQIVLDTPTHFTFRARLDSDLRPHVHAETLRRIDARLRELLAQKHLEHVTFTIDEVDALSVDPRTGKFRLVVRRQPEPELISSRSPQ